MQNLSKENIIQFLKLNKAHIQSKFGVLSIGLMGSYARDEQTADSDIDFIVEFDDENFSKIAGLADFLETAFVKKVDVIRKTDTMRKSLILRSNTEAIYA